MNRVYVPAVTEGWEWALPTENGDDSKIVEMFGQPLGDKWTPPRMKLLQADEYGRKWAEADMPWMGSHILILKPRALLVLRDLCLQAGELLPMANETSHLTAWNVTTVVDALDLEKSKVLRFPGGRIMSIEQHYFKPALIEGIRCIDPVSRVVESGRRLGG